MKVYRLKCRTVNIPVLGEWRPYVLTYGNYITENFNTWPA
jgi:hypothetical protein